MEAGVSATLTELPPAAVGKHYNPAKMTHGGPDAVVRVRPGRLGPVGFARLPGNQHSLPTEIPPPRTLVAAANLLRPANRSL